MREVIFDSSFLMAVAAEPTTWFEDLTDSVGKFEPVILECVVGELERIAASEGKKSRLARVSLDLAQGFRRWKCGRGSTDDEIASAALARKASVATADAALAENLRKLHVAVVGLRSGRVSVR